MVIAPPSSHVFLYDQATSLRDVSLCERLDSKGRFRYRLYT